MKLAEGIRRHGFRKWYERQLLQSHAHLAFTFLCLVGVFAALEALRGTVGWSQRWEELLSALLCGGAGLWALRRYLHLLHTAEYAANQAECPQCKVYGRLDLMESDAAGDSVVVRCRSCGHGWRIDS
jgi:ABC-type nickel/cobalt efflux system permease component RcnA